MSRGEVKPVPATAGALGPVGGSKRQAPRRSAGAAPEQEPRERDAEAAETAKAEPAPSGGAEGAPLLDAEA